MHFAKSKLLNLNEFRQALASATHPTLLFKQAIRDALLQLQLQQREGVSSADILSKYTWMIDQLICVAWDNQLNLLPDNIKLELVAVGGYGRQELHPYSDVDLLILLHGQQYQHAQDFVESFIRFLWDIGLDVGHSFRSIKDCTKEARQDIKILTNLLEARHLTGEQSLLLTLDNKIRGGRVWLPEKYYTQKMQEQVDRHAQYQDTAYSLEPNLKESPGGLRDLHTILWIYNRHFGVRTFKQMNQQGHINDDEYRILIRARNVLWKMRASLHLNGKRHEDRLLFDSQRELATEYGYQDTHNQLAVEQMMKRYYRTAKQVIYLNEVLLAHYRVTHRKSFSLAVGRTIDDDFTLKNKLIEQTDADLFKRKPQAMLKLFVLMQKHKITGIHPDTIRSIRANLEEINTEFRNNIRSKSLFLELFKSQGTGLTNALARMNAYGVLGAYLPAFGAIVGQMQHDLFHVYTVDGHTLMVIRNLTRLRMYPDEYRIASDLLDGLYRPERLFVAALFHDIAKGRGGDHSILGEAEAYRFCTQHNMSEYDAKLVAWLVLNHLMMSHYSQRRDISDAGVIKQFADLVGDSERLDNLYLLTLADIKGTSPKVWNAWKGQLLLELYQATSQALRRGVAKPIDEQEHINDNKRTSLAKLTKHLEADQYDAQIIEQFWQTLPKDYFIRNQPYYIAWHAASLCQTPIINLPIVSVRFSERLQANMFFVYAPESNQLLCKVTAAFDTFDLSIIAAQLQSSNTGFALYSFNAIAPESEPSESADYHRFLEKSLRELILTNQNPTAIVRRKASRALKHFPIEPSVAFSFHNPSYTAMEVIAQDQPGFLHNVALILQRHKLKLLSAKIATFGEKAEDIFFIQQHDRTPVTKKSVLAKLETNIKKALDRNKK